MKARLLSLFLLVFLVACYPASEEESVRLGLDLTELGLELTGEDVQAWADWKDSDLALFDMNVDGNFFMTLGLVDSEGANREFQGFDVGFEDDRETGQVLSVDLAFGPCQDCHFEIAILFNYTMGTNPEFIFAEGVSPDFSSPATDELEFSLTKAGLGQVTVRSAGETEGDLSLFDMGKAVRYPKQTMQQVVGTSEYQAVFTQVPVGRSLDLQRHVVEGQDYVTVETVLLESAGEQLTVELP